jgi:general secretion pathway protein E
MNARARDDTDPPALVGQLLVERGRLDRASLTRATHVAASSGEPLHVVLVKLGMASERDMAETLAEALGLPLAGREDYPLEPVAELSVSVKFLKDARLVPLAECEAGLEVACADPLDGFAMRALEVAAGRPVLPRVGVPAEIEAALERLYSSGSSALREIIEAAGGADEAEEDVERLRDIASEAPVIRIVNLLIARAVESRASDVHIEPFEGRLRVRYRIDGVLREVESPPARLRAAIVSRIKIMARLNITERRLPQDGRIRLAVRGKEIDLRVSILPSMHGESVVLRILDCCHLRLELEALGFAPEAAEAYRAMMHRPNGTVLVTGPTGSGKTSTLYASLVELNRVERKIVTVEDPIEYQLDGINQIQTRPQIGLDFANVLRSVLRHDPDIIMVGEIRDLETAKIAVQAALTGHLVLSTLHTNSAAASITRLLDMGIEDYLLTSTINGIVAQRLVRTLCPHCREPYRPLPELLAQLGAAAEPDSTLFRTRGCEHCNSTGYLGRAAVVEVLPMSDPIRKAVLARTESHELQWLAVSEGLRTMHQDGLAKVLAGVTTLDEVLRVTREA